MSPEEVAERLNGRPSGDGWSARCPAHEDRSPSLSIAAGDKDVAAKSLVAAESEIMRAAGKGVFHKNTASRKVSRLTARVRAI